MSAFDDCIVCKQKVRPRQEAIQCDGCSLWNHRTCSTGISRQEYWTAVREDKDIEWRCPLCPLLESTRLEEEADVTPLLFDSATPPVPEAAPEDSATGPEQPSQEASLEDSDVDPDLPDQPHQVETSYHLVLEGTIRGKTKLVTNTGYTFNVRKRRPNGTIDWQCTVRRKDHRCKASVIQRDGAFFPGLHGHNHPGEFGVLASTQIQSRVKQMARENLFRPASAIINEVLLDERVDENPCPSLPKPVNMARATNRMRQQLRPEDPTDLSFELSEENIPDGFLKSDVSSNGKRHLIFATRQQLQQLVKSKNWYVDGTFKLCRQPFSQLFTINAFVRSSEQAKQVPLLFALMSGRRQCDYRAVLQAAIDLLPSPPEVRSITLDFETALWNMFRDLLPSVSLKGCLFHWTQALWRKVQELGLEPPYRNDSRTYKYIRKLMALPFLPAARILPEFQRLKDGARTASLEALVQYVENNWISSTVWPPAAWSVYMLPIRTNNDVEGWHNSLNRRANNRVHLPFYLLVELLHQEARLVSIQIKLVSDGKLSRIQRKKYRLLQSKIFKYWEDFNNDEITARRLLKRCSYLNGPSSRT